MYYLLVIVLVACFSEQAAGKNLENRRKDPCDDFYCANGGVCILEDVKHSHSSEDIESSEDKSSGEDRQSGEGRHSVGHGHFVPTCQCNGDWKGDRCDEDPCDNVDCNAGTCSHDDNGQTSCSCPEFTSGKFCENFVTCPEPESPTNGQVTVEDVTVGSTATYTCDSATMAVCIHEILTCGNDGDWDKEPPVCVEQFGPHSYLDVSYGNSTYYFSNEELYFSEAKPYCETLGGQLVSINSEEEWKFIKCLQSQRNINAVYRIWIGLVWAGDILEWVNGEPVTMNSWETNPLILNNEEWACATSDGEYWLTYSEDICLDHDDYIFHFICEFPGSQP